MVKSEALRVDLVNASGRTCVVLSKRRHLAEILRETKEVGHIILIWGNGCK